MRTVLLIAVLVAVYVALPISGSAGAHRSSSVRHEFQLIHPCPSTGLTSGACPGWVKDHFVPLAGGGPDAVSNMQWQTIRDVKAKDNGKRRAAVIGMPAAAMVGPDQRLQVRRQPRNREHHCKYDHRGPSLPLSSGFRWSEIA
jgi:hypothetical protein